MPLNLCNHREKAADALKHFRQSVPGSDHVGPADVETGDPMGGFVHLMRNLVEANGLPDATISLQHATLPRPGLFCPAKLWSLVVRHRDRVIAALDLKSQVAPAGPDSGNLAADALGSSHDFWTAYREGAFGVDVPKPFLGWLILVDDTADAVRYKQLCKTLDRGQHYTAACVVHGRPDNGKQGRYEEGSEPKGLTLFVADFAAHMAACSRRKQRA